MHVADGLGRLLLLPLGDVFPGATDAVGGAVEAPDVVAKRLEEEDVVAAAAAGHEGGLADDGARLVAERVAAAVRLLGGRDEVVTLGQEVGEGEAGPAAVPGVEVVLVEVVPGRGVIGGRGGGKGVAEDVGVGGVRGGAGGG